MNYLAHAYLSFGDDEILVGNMISDFVKGKKQFDYPLSIQHGITLHRMIDTFTDAHAATKAGAAFFKPVVGTYGGAFMDVVYDHFIATDKSQFFPANLAAFADETYAQLETFTDILPERFRTMLPFMISQNWLLNYSTDTGIHNSFKGIFRRAKYIEYTPYAFECFKENYNALAQCYQDFFPAIKQYAFSQFKVFTESLHD